eukprot:941263-Rhodomonas_salina.1
MNTFWGETSECTILIWRPNANVSGRRGKSEARTNDGRERIYKKQDKRTEKGGSAGTWWRWRMARRSWQARRRMALTGMNLRRAVAMYRCRSPPFQYSISTPSELLRSMIRT